MNHKRIEFFKKCRVEQNTQTDKTSEEFDVYKPDHNTKSDLNSMSF